MPGLLSIVIPCYNNETTIGAQLAAIAAQEYAGPYEVVIADNGSTDTSRTIAQQFSARLRGLRVIDASAQRGAAFARNEGARHARGSHLLFCDADDEMGAGYVEAMARALERHDFVACRYDFRRLNHSWLVNARGACDETSGPETGYCHPTLPYAGAGGLGILKSVHDRVSGFDLTLRAAAGQEDTDYCIRVQLAGTPLVYVPDAVMHVRFRDSVAGVFRQAWAWAESGLYVQRRYESKGTPHPSAARVTFDLARHLAYKALRVRSRDDLAQFVWLAGWCGGLATAARRLERQGLTTPRADAVS